MDKKASEGGWCSSTFALGEQEFVETLSYSESQFPENLSIATLTKQLVARKILRETEILDKEDLVALFRKYLLPKPQRNNDLQRMNAGLKAVSLGQNSNFIHFQRYQ